jgi:hypothetical protein
MRIHEQLCLPQLWLDCDADHSAYSDLTWNMIFVAAFFLCWCRYTLGRYVRRKGYATCCRKEFQNLYNREDHGWNWPRTKKTLVFSHPCSPDACVKNNLQNVCSRGDLQLKSAEVLCIPCFCHNEFMQFIVSGFVLSNSSLSYVAILIHAAIVGRS